jgi:2-C-methyl-D-erythritol 2,4-cyclodiphosphate synthase
MRIGSGFDVHAFTDGDHVMLGGVRIAHDKGVAAHSDGDVLLHALCDALLGALALGDIGTHFPPTDERWRGADSREFLRHCASLVKGQGWRLGNADLTVICQAPKVGPHAQAIRESIAHELGVEFEQVSDKETTTE